MSTQTLCKLSAALFLAILIASIPACTTGKEFQTPVQSDSEAALRQEVATFAQQFVGTKYKYAGRDPRTGFDCSGFTGFVLGYFNVPVSGPSASQEKLGKPIDLSNARAGDLIFFRRTRSGSVFHVSLVVSNGPEGLTVVHSTSSRGVVVDNIPNNSYWREKHATARDVISK